MQYTSMLLVKLNSLSRHNVVLRSCLKKLSKQYNSELVTKENLWVVILGALENAMRELHEAANRALTAATAKVEVMNVADLEIMDGLAHRITNLLAEMGKAHSAYMSLEGMKASQDR